MSHCRFWRRASLCLAVLLAPFAAAAAQTPPSASPPDTATLILAVEVDGKAQEEPVMVHRSGDRVRMRASDLRALGIMTGADADEIDLSTIPRLRFDIDDARQTLKLHGWRQSTLRAEPAGEGPPPLTPNGWGAVLNYDVTAYSGRGGTLAGGSFESVVFGPGGYGFAGAVASVRGGGAASLLRTDAGYTLSRPDRLLRATIGDFINGASDTSRPVRMAGLKIGTDFSLRPDLVTFPLANVAGAAAVASSVDLIVNGNLQRVGDVSAGTFTASDIPVQTGINSITTTVRDPLGRATVRTVTTYASRAQLRAGLSAFSAEAGFVRTGYYTPRDHYRAFAASGTWRRGLSDAITVEAHGEGSRDLLSGSIGASWNLGRFGLATAAIGASTPAASTGAASTGAASLAGPRRAGIASQVSIGVERIARPVSVAVHYVRTAAGWRDLANQYGSLTYRHSLVLNLGFDLARYGTLGVSMLDLGRGSVATNGRGDRLAAAVAKPAATFVNATYSVRLTPRLSLLANLGGDMRRRRSRFAALGAVMVFGNRTSGYAGLNRDAGSRVASTAISRSAIVPGDWGYRASAATGSLDRAGAGVQYLGRAGWVEAAVEDAGGAVAGQISARGSLGYAGRHAFAGQTLTESFAMIETSGRPGIAIYRDNRPIGTTDGKGRLIVPNLPGYETAKFSIDPTSIDPSLAVHGTEAQVRPAQRVGVKVSFDIEADRSVILTLVDEAGRLIPVGTRGTFNGRAVVTGFDGMAYLTADDGGPIIMTTPDGRRCGARIPPGRKSGRLTLACTAALASLDRPVPARPGGDSPF